MRDVHISEIVNLELAQHVIAGLYICDIFERMLAEIVKFLCIYLLSEKKRCRSTERKLDNLGCTAPKKLTALH